MYPNNACFCSSCRYVYFWAAWMCSIYIWDLYEKSLQCGSYVCKTRVAGRLEMQMFLIRYRSAIKHMLMLLGFIKPRSICVPCFWARLQCSMLNDLFVFGWLLLQTNKLLWSIYALYVVYMLMGGGIPL